MKRIYSFFIQIVKILILSITLVLFFLGAVSKVNIEAKNRKVS